MMVFLKSRSIEQTSNPTTAVTHVRAAVLTEHARQEAFEKKKRGKVVALHERGASALSDGEQKRTRLMSELLFKHRLDHCKFIIKAACFITELGHYSRALCTIFSKPIRARWRALAHPRKDGIFTFHHLACWILIWLLWFSAAALLSVSHELPNGFVNIPRDFWHYPSPVSSGRCNESHRWSLLSVKSPSPIPVSSIRGELKSKKHVWVKKPKGGAASVRGIKGTILMRFLPLTEGFRPKCCLIFSCIAFVKINWTFIKNAIRTFKLNDQAYWKYRTESSASVGI